MSFPNHTPISSNDYASTPFGHGVLANTFQNCTWELEPLAFTSCLLAQFHILVYRGLVSYLSEHLQSGREERLACSD
jgi:hypothetical protein